METAKIIGIARQKHQHLKKATRLSLYSLGKLINAYMYMHGMLSAVYWEKSVSCYSSDVIGMDCNETQNSPRRSIPLGRPSVVVDVVLSTVRCSTTLPATGRGREGERGRGREREGEGGREREREGDGEREGEREGEGGREREREGDGEREGEREGEEWRERERDGEGREGGRKRENKGRLDRT